MRREAFATYCEPGLRYSNYYYYSNSWLFGGKNIRTKWTCTILYNSSSGTTFVYEYYPHMITNKLKDPFMHNKCSTSAGYPWTVDPASLPTGSDHTPSV